ncbi:MAG: hypothetical protein Q8R28_17310 [Dehalococcoidia bacterium]|nr:hypothetical protein [Dehalococcoidia bacterium]
MRQKVTVFRPYPLELGQRIRIDGGPRAGDWEVIGLTERKVTLRCPVSSRVVEWDRFCYWASDLDREDWPRLC